MSGAFPARPLNNINMKTNSGIHHRYEMLTPICGVMSSISICFQHKSRQSSENKNITPVWFFFIFNLGWHLPLHLICEPSATKCITDSCRSWRMPGSQVQILQVGRQTCLFHAVRDVGNNAGTSVVKPLILNMHVVVSRVRPQ